MPDLARAKQPGTTHATQRPRARIATETRQHRENNRDVECDRETCTNTYLVAGVVDKLGADLEQTAAMQPVQVTIEKRVRARVRVTQPQTHRKTK
jgi:hypothetical protein